MTPDAPAGSDRSFDVVGLAGSLRRGSYNRALLRAAAEIAAPRLRIVSRDIGGLPFYNADFDTDAAPQSVVDLREAVRRADGLLIASPEYNHGVPGVLKNAIDWLSRPPETSVLDKKAAAIMGASTGPIGTARAQLELRLVLASTDTYVLLEPEVLVARAADKFDADGRLTDEGTRTFLAAFLDRFIDLLTRLETAS